MQWNTSRMVELLKGGPDWDITVRESGGNVDTECLILKAKGAADAYHLVGQPDARLFVTVCGFVTDNVVHDDKHADVDMIELQDGLSGEGGLTTDDPPTVALYNEVRMRLRGAGFEVVRSMDEYF